MKNILGMKTQGNDKRSFDLLSFFHIDELKISIAEKISLRDEEFRKFNSQNIEMYLNTRTPEELVQMFESKPLINHLTPNRSTGAFDHNIEGANALINRFVQSLDENEKKQIKAQNRVESNSVLGFILNEEV